MVKKSNFLNTLKRKVLVLDGAMGTMFIALKVKTNCYDELNLTQPKTIEEIHKQYIESGADIIETNTFGANSYKLKKFKLSKKTIAINKAAVKIAKLCKKKYGNNKTFIAGSVGPLGEYLEPIGKLTFDEAFNIYKEQISGLKESDFILIETTSDIRLMKAAVLAAKSVTSLPIFVSATFQDERTTLGTDVETFVNIISSLGVDGIGTNCSSGPEDYINIIKTITKCTNLPIIMYPNAGLPKIKNNETIYDYSTKKFANFTKSFVKLGANIVGGCCGTNPTYIKQIKKSLKEQVPKKRTIQYEAKISSRTNTINFSKPLLVGERINPTGRKDIASELRKNNYSTIKKEAINQNKSGAHILDVNVGLPDINEKKAIKKAILEIQELTNCPLMIDTGKTDALEEALKTCNGRPIINSVNASPKSLKTIFPLAKKYGALVIGLTLDENKIPKTAKERIRLAKKIITFGQKYISKDDIIIDPLIATISAEQTRAKITLQTVKELKKLNIKTNLGVSNVSHGLPNRPSLNSAFLSLALYEGLNLAIINPYEKESINTFLSTNVLNNIDKDAINYISNFKGTQKQTEYTKLPISEKITNAIINGDNKNILKFIKEALKKYKPLEINNFLVKGLNIVGEKYQKKEFFLPQMLNSANAMKDAFKELKKHIPKKSQQKSKTILFATVKGDIHDIGKNIVITMLETQNYKVIDLGVDVGYSRIKNAIKKNNPKLICLSTLMTTTVKEIEIIKQKLIKDKIKIPVMIGGAVLNKEYAKKIDTEFAKDALVALKSVQKILK